MKSFVNKKTREWLFLQCLQSLTKDTSVGKRRNVVGLELLAFFESSANDKTGGLWWTQPVDSLMWEEAPQKTH